ncbi:MAG: hypothetical protein JXR95_07825 [Deltaproteobacteria bacterium]|nr:hypothetical protein [Deltaproteobacteria bacterium]
MKKITMFMSLLMAFSLTSQVDARKKSKKKKKATTSAKAQAAIKTLQGEFKFGMSKKQVQNLLIKDIKKRYAKIILKTRGDLQKDEQRAKMNKEIANIKSKTVTFNGQTTGWDTSIIDDQYAHKNYESMIPIIDLDKQKFFFFFNDQLYRIFITLPKDQYKGFNFAKFQSVIEGAYGKAEEIFMKGIGGDTELHHLLWKGTSGTELWAMDKTDVYGNFVLIVLDGNRRQKVAESRKDRGVKIPGAGELEVNPMVKVVTAGSGVNTKKKTDKKKKK